MWHIFVRCKTLRCTYIYRHIDSILISWFHYISLMIISNYTGLRSTELRNAWKNLKYTETLDVMWCLLYCCILLCCSKVRLLGHSWSICCLGAICLCSSKGTTCNHEAASRPPGFRGFWVGSVMWMTRRKMMSCDTQNNVFAIGSQPTGCLSGLSWQQLEWYWKALGRLACGWRVPFPHIWG